MILLELTPLSKPVAISEMLILLAVAAFIGWLIGRWIHQSRITDVRERIARRSSELNDCENQSNLAEPRHFAGPLVEVTEEPDDLKIIEGIGPAIERLLNAEGIFRFQQLANTPAGRLTEILNAGGARFQIHDPGSWPTQAALARDNQWDELKTLQDRLNGGK